MSDIEKTETYESSSAGKVQGYAETSELSRWTRIKDSFKPADYGGIDVSGLSELERAELATAQSPLARSLKGRHLQMIAIGGSIGTGLFVGSGKILHNGGPAGLLIGFILVGMMLFCTVHALGELAVVYPVSGAFSTLSTRFLDPAWGFAMGWNYALQWLIVLPVELVAASITINYWQSDINNVAWIAIFYVLIMALNMFGARGYGEGEFVFSLIKVIAVVGYIILAIVLITGGGPNEGYIGGRYWQHPGAFAHGFKGVCAVFVTAAFSFTGTELVGLAAAETANPRKTVPSATKQVFWRITLFYIISLTLVGLLVPYDDGQLLGSSSADATASPFVISIKRAGIKVLPSIFNVVIMIAVLSVGNSAVFGASRTVAALAAQGFAPRILGYIDRQGRPLAGIALSGVIGLLSFVAASPKQSDVFAWLMALSGLSSIFTWGSICLCHIRFRAAMKYHGRSLDDIPFRSQPGIIGSWFGFGFNCLVLVAQFWVALYPIKASPDPAVFFQSYLAAPLVIVFYLSWKIYKRSPFIRLKDIDLDAGRREVDLDLLRQELAEERAELQKRGFLYRVYKTWC